MKVRLIYASKSIFVKVNRFSHKFSDNRNEMEDPTA